MILYLDMTFLKNFLFDYLLLQMTVWVSRKRCSVRRLVGSALLGALLSCISIWLYTRQKPYGLDWSMLLQLGNGILAMIMLRICFRFERRKQLLIYLVVFYGMAFGLEGIYRMWVMQFAGGNETFPLWALFGALIFGVKFWKLFIQSIWQQKQDCENYIPFVLRVGGHEIEGVGFLDSGNSLKEPITGKPVVLVSESFIEKYHLDTSYFFAIPYHAIGTEEGILKAIRIEELVLQEKSGERHMKEVLLGIYQGKLCKNHSYQMLLHPSLYG